MILQISSGQGPAECELGVAKLAEYILRRDPNAKILDRSVGSHRNIYRSVKIETAVDLSHLIGSVLWVCKSPYRPAHERKNWFLDVSLCQSADFTAFDAEKIRYETVKSRGKGGQHVNKTESAVRATYLPTGDTVVCMEERSQYLNKQRAAALLRERADEANRQNAATQKDRDWRRHTQLVRGDAVAVFEGMAFRPVT